MSRQNGHVVPPQDGMRVSVLTGFGAEGEPVYEQHYLNRPANTVFQEPLDLSENDSTRRSEHQKYHSERERLKTFEGNWKLEYHMKKEDLAKDGFIYKGPGDRTMCVFCLKSIRKWEPQDTVRGEHKRLYPFCPWVQGKAIKINKPISEAESVKRDIGVSRKGLPQSTDMQDLQVRLKTYQYWAKRKTVNPMMLSTAGFFYDDGTEILQCYHCGMKVPVWDSERNLFQRHKQDFPNCPMAQQMNGTVNHPDEVVLGSPNNVNLQNGASSSASQNHSVNVDEDMQSPAVQAVVSEFPEYDMEAIRNAVEMLRLSKGSGNIHAHEILEKLEPGPDDEDMDT